MSSQSVLVAPSMVYVATGVPSGRIPYTAGAPPESSYTHSSGGWVWLAATPDTSFSTGSASAASCTGVAAKRSQTVVAASAGRVRAPMTIMVAVVRSAVAATIVARFTHRGRRARRRDQ